MSYYRSSLGDLWPHAGQPPGDPSLEPIQVGYIQPKDNLLQKRKVSRQTSAPISSDRRRGNKADSSGSLALMGKADHY